MSRVMYLSPNSTRAENSGGRMRCSFIAATLATFCELKVITLGDLAAKDDPTVFTPSWEFAEFPVLYEEPHSKLLRLTATIARGRGFHTDLLCDGKRWKHLAGTITAFKPDLVILGNCFIAQLARLVREVAPDARLVLDSHNVEWQLCRRLARSSTLSRPQRLKMLIRSWLIRAVERRAIAACDETWAVSSKDAEALECLGGTKIQVIPNTINLEKYHPAPLRGDGTISFVGWYSYISNEDAALFLLDCSAQLLQRGISHKLLLAGRSPTARMLERALGMQQVAILGDVENAQAVISAADIFAVPLFTGSGTRFKILEAMALGRCVVTTPLGREGLGCQAGRDLIVSDADSFVDTIARLLTHHDEAAITGNNGRKWIENNHSPESTRKVIAERVMTLTSQAYHLAERKMGRCHSYDSGH